MFDLAGGMVLKSKEWENEKSKEWENKKSKEWENKRKEKGIKKEDPRHQTLEFGLRQFQEVSCTI